MEKNIIHSECRCICISETKDITRNSTPGAFTPILVVGRSIRCVVSITVSSSLITSTSTYKKSCQFYKKKCS